ncbi:MAG TPA: glycosyltransferase family 4 protein, partial [Bacteroidota bacterium]
PLFLGLSALLIRFLKKSKVVVNVQDLFPQSAVDLGVLRSRPLIWLFRKIESLIYRRSNLITVHSAGNRDHVVRSGGRKETTIEVPNLVDTDKIVPGDRLNAFRTKYRIPSSEFVVSFAGVIGLSQDLDTVIDAAKLTQERSVVYYIVGDGIEKARLMKKAEGVPNVRFLPMLPKNEYVELLHASDLCLVTLRKEVMTPVVPSKILSIMAAGRPILASMPLSGDAPALVQTAGCGICIPPENSAEMAGAVTKFAERRDENVRMGMNGRDYVVSHCSLQACTSRYEQLFTSLLPNE